MNINQCSKMILQAADDIAKTSMTKIFTVTQDRSFINNELNNNPELHQGKKSI